MKRLAGLIMAVIMSMCLISCGSNKDEYTEINSDSVANGFSITNELGGTIKEFYVSQSDMSDWGDDLLNGSTLDNGEKIDLAFSGEPLSSKIFDISVLLEDDTEYQIKHVDIAALGSIKLLIIDDKPVAEKQ